VSALPRGEIPSGHARPLALRALLTMAVALFAVLSRDVAAPGLSYDGFAQPAARGGALGLFALGITPVLSGMALAEIVAAVVPRWRHLRHSGPAGRARLTRVGALLAVAFAVLQVVAATRYIEALSTDGPAFPARFGRELYAVSVFGAVLVSWAVAYIGSRAGLVNGYVVVFLVPIVVEGVRAVARAPEPVRNASLAPLALALVVSFAALAVVRSRAWVPLVGVPPLYAASFVPVSVGLGGPVGHPVILALVTALAVVVFTRLFYDEDRIRAALPATLFEPADHRGALLASVLVGSACLGAYFTVLLALPHPQLGESGFRQVGVVGFVGLAALVLDAGSACRAALGPHTSRVALEHRAWAVPAIERALAAAGIGTTLRNARLFAAFQFFFPMVPVEVWVAPGDARRARRLIARVAKRGPVEGGPPPVARPMPRWLLALSTVGALLTLFFPWKMPEPAPPPRVAVAVVRLDDDVDPFDGATDLPKGGAVQEESVPLGVDAQGKSVQAVRHYVRVVRLPDEAVEALHARARAWLAGRSPPPETTFALGDFLDDVGGKPTVVAVRTFVLRGVPILTNDDIESADPAISPDREYYVAVALVGSAAERFRAATAAWRQRRLALLLDGRVDTTPVVNAVLDRNFSITLGGLDRKGKQSRAAAERLAAAIRSK